MGDKVAGIELDLYFVFALPDLNTSADPGDRNGVTITVQGHVAFHVYRAFMQAIHFRNPYWQLAQMTLLQHKQLAGHGSDMFLVSRVDAVAPLPCLLVQLLPTGEGAACQEVVLDKVKRPLYATGTVGIAALMGLEAETVTFGKGGHLGDRNHLTAGAAQHHDMGVVDHDPLHGSPAEVTYTLGQKHLAIEALEGWVQLEEQHARVTQDG